jgi:alkanesulfonate monooxygenase SsuD/methylene tetrahydromethanopterin reductase-like flavin-dependent oxidoreductase (luciferase family)
MEPDVGTNDPELGLAVGGSPERVADYVRQYAELGLGEVIFVFRAPFDRPTIERLAEVRAAEDPHRG